jgi:YVTN family beta-propeller protein
MISCKHRLVPVCIVAFTGIVLLGARCSLFNKAPLVPVVTGPTTNIVGVPVTFSATTTDPDVDSVAFQFDWGDSSVQSLTGFVASGESIVATHTYADSGAFTVRARAEDRSGKQSQWSAGSTISCLLDQPPLVPTVSGPSASFARMPVTFMTTTTDPEGESIAVSFDWGDGSAPAWTAFVASGETIAATRAYADSGTYTVKARAKDTGGRESRWSVGSTIVVAPPPDCPDSVVNSIAVGGDPTNVICSPSGDYVYVANETDDHITVARTSDRTVVARILCEDSPWEVCSNSDGSYLYASNLGSSSMSVIRTSDNQVVATAPIGSGPCLADVTPNGAFVYVTNSASNSVSVIKAADNQVVATVPVGSSPRGATCLSNGEYVYIGNRSGNSVSVIRTSDNQVVTTIPVNGGAHRVRATLNGAYVYASLYGQNRIDVISTATNTVVGSISLPGNPVGIWMLPGTVYAYVCCATSNSIAVVRTTDHVVAAEIPVGFAPWGVASDAGGTRVYTADRYSRSISIIGRR